MSLSRLARIILLTSVTLYADPMPWQTPGNDAAHANDLPKQETDQKQTDRPLAPGSVRTKKQVGSVAATAQPEKHENDDRPKGINIADFPQISVQRDWYDKLAVCLTALLCGVGVIGTYVGLKTLRAIERQARLMSVPYSQWIAVEGWDATGMPRERDSFGQVVSISALDIWATISNPTTFPLRIVRANMSITWHGGFSNTWRVSDVTLLPSSVITPRWHVEISGEDSELTSMSLRFRVRGKFEFVNILGDRQTQYVLGGIVRKRDGRMKFEPDSQPQEQARADR